MSFSFPSDSIELDFIRGVKNTIILKPFFNLVSFYKWLKIFSFCLITFTILFDIIYFGEAWDFSQYLVFLMILMVIPMIISSILLIIKINKVARSKEFSGSTSIFIYNLLSITGALFFLFYPFIIFAPGIFLLGISLHLESLKSGLIPRISVIINFLALLIIISFIILLIFENPIFTGVFFFLGYYIFLTGIVSNLYSLSAIILLICTKKMIKILCIKYNINV